MKDILGTVVTAMIVDKNEKNLFAQKEGVTFKVLDGDLDSYDMGDMIEGFIYVNKSDAPVMLTEVPEIQVGTYGWGEVAAVQHDLGVFVDVGWEDKDLVVSLDDLPVFMNLWPRKGDKLYVTVEVDSKNRMWGKFADINDWIEKANEGNEAMHNDDVSGTVIAALKAGSYLQLEDELLGFVHPEERDEEPRLGKPVEGRVIGLRNDGVLYVSLLPRAHEVLDEDAAMIFVILKRSPGNRIPYHDKSDPDAIRTFFGISKGQFKRAVGRLMKEGLVLQDKEGTYLTEKGLEREID
jgi:hypothetical protein